VVEPGQGQGHSRTFLPDTVYTALSTVSLRLLREADGTAFFLLRAGTGTATLTALDPGQYRLALTFRRDNTALDPQSLVLSEAGDRSPERAALDVPRRGR
jgi:hypothetical protein